MKSMLEVKFDVTWKCFSIHIDFQFPLSDSPRRQKIQENNLQQDKNFNMKSKFDPWLDITYLSNSFYGSFAAKLGLALK